MAHYKKDASSNRDALFGSSGGGKSNTAAPRTSRPQQQRPKATTITSAVANNNSTPPSNNSFGFTSSSTTNVDSNITPGPSTIFTSHGRLASKSTPMSLLTGQAKITKMAEAEE